MRKLYHLTLPVIGLALLLGSVALVSSEGYHVQYLNGEWVEFTEHWVDQKQEAIQSLQEYARRGDSLDYRRYAKAGQRVDSHSEVVQNMIDPRVKKQNVQEALVKAVGYEREDAEGLVWHARVLRPFLGVENDYYKWRKVVKHWEKLKPLAKQIRRSVEKGDHAEQTLQELRDRLHSYAEVSRRHDGAIQDEVEAASLELKAWSNTITMLLALVLFLGGAMVIWTLYRYADESQVKFRTLFESSPDGVVIADTNGSIKQCNQSFKRLFGYTDEEIKGDNLDRLLTSTNAEYKEARYMSSRLRKNEVFQEEVIRYNNEGEAIPVLLSAVPVAQNGKVGAYFAIYIDISEQKRLEEKNRKLLEKERKLRTRAEESRERFKMMFEESPAAVALIRASDYEYLYTNKTHRKLTGKQAEGEKVRDKFPEYRDQQVIDILDKVCKTGQTIEGREEPLEIYRDGESITIHRDYVYKPLKDSEGKLYAIFVDFVDVTDRVEFRRKLQDELQEKTTLLEEIHHRVKNNLAAITGMLQLQMDYITDQRAREALLDSELRIHTLADIHEMLYESEKLSKIAIEEYIRKLVTHIRQVTGITDRIDVDIQVESFTLDVQQAQPLALLMNELIQNAFKHAFPDGQRGRIEVRGSLDENTVHIQINDNGIGISEEKDRPKGLGMELVKNISEQLEAEVDIENKKGTTFHITFEKTGV